MGDRVYVHYFDYLGFEHTGYIILMQPVPGEDEEIQYCFIVDDRPEFNDKVYIDMMSGQQYQYAEIRRSDEVIRINRPERMDTSEVYEMEEVPEQPQV